MNSERRKPRGVRQHQTLFDTGQNNPAELNANKLTIDASFTGKGDNSKSFLLDLSKVNETSLDISYSSLEISKRPQRICSFSKQIVFTNTAKGRSNTKFTTK